MVKCLSVSITLRVFFFCFIVAITLTYNHKNALMYQIADIIIIICYYTVAQLYNNNMNFFCVQEKYMRFYNIPSSVHVQVYNIIFTSTIIFHVMWPLYIRAILRTIFFLPFIYDFHFFPFIVEHKYELNIYIWFDKACGLGIYIRCNGNDLRIALRDERNAIYDIVCISAMCATSSLSIMVRKICKQITWDILLVIHFISNFHQRFWLSGLV